MVLYKNFVRIALVPALVAAGDTSDAYRNFSEICAENGFAFEQHQVVTEDHYVLTVYRIPGLQGDISSGKPPIFF